MLIDIDPDTEEPDYIGEMEVDYDSYEPVHRDGKVLFVDEDGGEWTFDQLQVEPL